MRKENAGRICVGGLVFIGFDGAALDRHQTHGL